MARELCHYISIITSESHLAVYMLQLPEVHSVLASTGQARAMIAEMASLCETTARDQDVILPPKISRQKLLANLLKSKSHG